MLHKGMLKNADGTPMKKDDFRSFTNRRRSSTDPMRTIELPDDLKAPSPRRSRIADQGQADFDRLSDGQKKGFHPATTKDWDATVDLIKFVDNLRRRRRPDPQIGQREQGRYDRLFSSDFTKAATSMTVAFPSFRSNSWRY